MMDLRSVHRQIYFMTYTQFDAMVQNYACGSGLDLGLNEEGLESATKVARRFKKNPFKFKKIVSSPELRSVQMADVLHDSIKTKMSIYQELSDQFLGDYEGVPMSPDLDFTQPPKGETGIKFHDRIKNVFKELLMMEPPLLLVTHSRVIQAGLLSLGLPPQELQGLIIPGELYVLDLPVHQGLPKVRNV